MPDVLALRWRIGRCHKNIYALLGDEPSENDLLVAEGDNTDVLSHIVDLHNASL